VTSHLFAKFVFKCSPCGLPVEDASIGASSSWSHYEESRRSSFFSQYQGKNKRHL
jgi:hypothetical protein